MKTYKDMIRMLEESSTPSDVVNYISFSDYSKREGVFKTSSTHASLSSPETRNISADEAPDVNELFLKAIKKSDYRTIEDKINKIAKAHSDEVIKIVETANMLCNAEFTLCNTNIYNAIKEMAEGTDDAH